MEKQDEDAPPIGHRDRSKILVLNCTNGLCQNKKNRRECFSLLCHTAGHALQRRRPTFHETGKAYIETLRYTRMRELKNTHSLFLIYRKRKEYNAMREVRAFRLMTLRPHPHATATL